MRRLRVGRIAALNMYPIYHGLERAGDPALTFTDGVPTELNRALLDGRLDVSAMSSIAFARTRRRAHAGPGGLDHRRGRGRLDPALLPRAVRRGAHGGGDPSQRDLGGAPADPARPAPVPLRDPRRVAGRGPRAGGRRAADRRRGPRGPADPLRAPSRRPGRALEPANRASDGVRGVGRPRRRRARAGRGAGRAGRAAAGRPRGLPGRPGGRGERRRAALPVPRRLHPPVPEPPALRVRRGRARGARRVPGAVAARRASWTCCRGSRRKMATVATTVAPARVGDILERTLGGERLSRRRRPRAPGLAATWWPWARRRRGCATRPAIRTS